MPAGSGIACSRMLTPLYLTILVGDSGVGKTSLLVQFDQGKFIPGSFSATVGIGFTVMLLGDSGVGKTCFLLQFKDGAFLSGTFIATVGIDFRNKVVAVDGVKVKLQIWDTAGQERFRSITHAYYRDAQALLLLYDITSKMSFDNIRAWLTEIHEYAQKDVVIMLLGNKADVSSERAVRTEDGASLAREYGVPFMETSAKTGMNVELAFLAIAKLHRVAEEEIQLLCLRLRAAKRSQQPWGCRQAGGRAGAQSCPREPGSDKPRVDGTLWQSGVCTRRAIAPAPGSRSQILLPCRAMPGAYCVPPGE
ncbi:hypothetical protein QYF61_010321 [Mycteria americana]|uniref:small monomeric GTPase n=1 Tax=Mycteria americana TaxID=33587 RepID=A0AAN7RLP8_MYCAM|nr:hypothetical protein QYF61_010321 [Mycteria americana]